MVYSFRPVDLSFEFEQLPTDSAILSILTCE